MNRINLFRSKKSSNTPSNCNSVTWGKTNFTENYFGATASTLVFGALLLICSLTVGCSSEQARNDPPKPVAPTTPAPITQSAPASTPATSTPAMPVQQASAKPVHRKVVRKAPPTSTYADKTTGVSFEYPPGYALKTGDSANELVFADPMPMDFTQPGGVAVATVSLPESVYHNSDLTAAYFDVSVNKTLTADQCNEFSVPQPNPATPADPTVQATAQLASPPVSKLLIGDMELNSSNIHSDEIGKDARDESAKYYHVFQNGACYEFALKVATTVVKDAADSNDTAHTAKHVNREEVFRRLDKILATVKISPVQAEANAEAAATSVPAATSQAIETPAQ